MRPDRRYPPAARARSCAASAAFWAVAAVLLLAAAPPIEPQTEPQPAAQLGPPEKLCTLDDTRILEASGIAASRRHDGHFYIHNDSGDTARVFLVDSAGRTRLVLHLRAARNVDWEDAAATVNDAGRPAICIADIGDNDARRSELVLYRFDEPESLTADADPTNRATPRPAEFPASRPAELSVDTAAFRFRYEDGPANAEALAIHPRTGDAFILTKRTDGAADVYHLPAPWPADRVAVLRRIATLRIPHEPPAATIITAADISPDGRWLVARSYLCGWLWPLPADENLREITHALAQPPQKLLLAAERQGEAVCFNIAGRSILTVSEGRTPPLWRHALEPAPPTSAPVP